MSTTVQSAPVRRLARLAPALLVAYALALFLLSTATVESQGLAIALSVVCWLGFTALLLLLTAALTAAQMPRGAVVLTLAVSTGLWFVMAYRMGEEPPAWAGRVAICAMIVAMASFGRMLSWLFREANLLPPAMIVAGIVDLWGVSMGPVAHVAERSPETIAKASAALPGVASAGPGGFALANDLMIGPGDIAVAALVFGVVLAHRLGLRRNLVWMYALTIVGLGLVLATGWPIPGLVFLGLSGLLANWKAFRYTRRELRDVGIALAFAAILLIIGAFAWQRATPGNHDDGSDTAAEVRLQSD